MSKEKAKMDHRDKEAMWLVQPSRQIDEMTWQRAKCWGLPATIQACLVYVPEETETVLVMFSTNKRLFLYFST